MKPAVRGVLFACVSTLTLAALVPALAYAQSTDVGGPGKALTTGTVTSTTGTVTDGGAGGGVTTNAPMTLDTVTVNNATIASQTTTGLSLSAIGLTATLNGVNRISGATGISFTPTVVSQGSALSITDPGSSIIGTNGAGIALSAIQGTVSLNVGGSVTGTTAGILATSTLGGFNITATGVVTGQQGIVVSDSFVRSNGIVINASNVVGTNGTGISATNSGASIVVSAGNVTGSGAGAGISAISNAGSFGSGPVTVTAVGTVTGGTGGGIIAQSNDASRSGNVSVTANVVQAAGGIGIQAAARSGAAAVSVNSVTSAGSAGISASGSTVTINAGTVTGGGSGAGIMASAASTTSLGSVAVTATGAVKGGTGGGIVTQVFGSGIAGAIAITSSAVDASAGGSGISATTGGGTIAIAAGGPVTAKAAGILATSNGLSGSTTISAGTITSLTDNGIRVGGISIGDLNIGSASQRIGAISAVLGTGISDNMNGAASLFASQITGARGIDVSSVVIGNILIDVSGPVTALSGFGISAVNNGVSGLGPGAPITIKTAQVSATGGAGVYASSGSTITFNRPPTFDPITITTGAVTQTGGTVFTSTTDLKTVTSAYDIGIAALSYNGPISITANGAVTADGPAILAADTNGGAGAVSITANGPVTSLSGPAIYAQSGTGGVALNLNGNVTGLNGPAITAVSGSNATINLAAGIQVAGKVTTASTGVINIATAAGQTSTLTIGSGAVVGLLAGSTFNTAIRATGGVVKLINNGTIQGGIDFSGVVGASSSFTNTGTLSLQNGKVGDSINLAGVAFTGSGASTLVLDANVGAGPSGTQSDLLIVGSSAGRTNLVINDTNTAPSGFNPGGVTLVVGATHPGDFVLDARSTYYNASLFGGALDTPGFFFSQLGLAANGNTVLFSAPRVQAYQLATLPAQVEALWYAATAQADRQGLLRDRLHGDTGEGSAPGLWLKLDGQTADRDVDQRVAVNGTTYAYDAGYSQDTLGVSMGYDRSRPAAGGQGGTAYGLSAGYADARGKFNQMGTRIGLSGWSLGGYASYVAPSGLYASGAVGGEWLRANVRAPQVLGFTNQHPDVTTFGLSGETGLRLPLGAGMALEPSVGAAYMHASIDSFTSAGATFRYDDPESLRLSIGARLTGDTGWALGAGHTRYEASLRAVDDGMASNRTTLVNSGVDLVALDSFGKTFGEAKLGLTSEYRGGWRLTGALRARWSDKYNDEGVTASARWRF